MLPALLRYNVFLSKNSPLGQARGTAEPFHIEIGVPNCFRRRTFHVLNSIFQVRLMKRSASEPGLCYASQAVTSYGKLKRRSKNLTLCYLVFQQVIYTVLHIISFLCYMRSILISKGNKEKFIRIKSVKGDITYDDRYQCYIHVDGLQKLRPPVTSGLNS